MDSTPSGFGGEERRCRNGLVSCAAGAVSYGLVGQRFRRRAADRFGILVGSPAGGGCELNPMAGLSSPRLLSTIIGALSPGCSLQGLRYPLAGNGRAAYQAAIALSN